MPQPQNVQRQTPGTHSDSCVPFPPGLEFPFTSTKINSSKDVSLIYTRRLTMTSLRRTRSIRFVSAVLPS